MYSPKDVMGDFEFARAYLRYPDRVRDASERETMPGTTVVALPHVVA